MPTTTTGVATEFISFTRASNATVVDSNGLIDWAAHNLLLASEQFDASNWQKDQSGSTLPAVTANNAAAPNSTTTADKVDFGAIDAAGDYSFVYQAFTALDATYTFGIWVKAFSAGDVGKKLWLKMWNTAAVGQIAVTLTADWQYVSTSGALTAGGSRRVDIATIGSTQGGENQGAVSVLLWGAHLYRSDMGMQANTSAYPMYNPTTPKNLLGFTEDFSGTGWTRVNLLANGSGSVANAVVNPVNGLQTADLIVESTANGYHSLYRSFTSVANTPYLWSAYVKPAGRTIVQIAAQATGNVHIVEFNLTGAGTATTRSGSGTAAITALSDGWYRISTIATATGSGTAYWQVDLCSAANTNSYTGDGTSGIYLWGAQLSDSASLDPYVANHFAAPSAAAYYGPRRDFDPVTLACKGLLVEEQRSNVVLNSAAFGSWSDNGATVAANTVVSPDGTMTADELTRASATSDSRFQTVTFTGDGTKSVSIYVKYNTAPTFAVFLYDSTAVANRMLIDFAFTAGVPASSTVNSGSVEAIENVGGGWYRIKLLCPSVVAANTNVLYVYPARTGSANGQKTTFWGAQAENGSFATSLIPTGAATATRNADVASVSTQAFPYSASEGMLVANGSFIALGLTTTDGFVALGDGTTSNNISFFKSGANGVASEVKAGGSSQAFWSVSQSTQPFKAAIAYQANNTNLAVAGTARTADTTCTMPVVSTMYLGAIYSGTSYPMNGWLRQITYIPRRLSDAELAARTA